MRDKSRLARAGPILNVYAARGDKRPIFDGAIGYFANSLCKMNLGFIRLP